MVVIDIKYSKMDLTPLTSSTIQINSSNQKTILIGDSTTAPELSSQKFDFGLASYNIPIGPWQKNIKQLFWGPGEYEKGDLYLKAEEIEGQDQQLKTSFIIQHQQLRTCLFLNYDEKTISDFFDEDEDFAAIVFTFDPKASPSPKDLIQSMISKSNARLIIPLYPSDQQVLAQELLGKWFTNYKQEETKKITVTPKTTPSMPKILTPQA